MNSITKQHLLLSLSLILFAVATRFILHPANMTAVGAVALFSGMLLPKKYAVATILSVTILSDMLIGLHSLVVFTWGSFLVITLVANRWKGRTSLRTTFFGALFSSTLFFIVTNFGVWLEGRLYTLDFQGLLQCYANALPFYRNMLLGDLLYTGILLGAYALTKNSISLFVSERTARV